MQMKCSDLVACVHAVSDGYAGMIFIDDHADEFVSLPRFTGLARHSICLAAKLLDESKTTKTQAFAVSRPVIELQFHMPTEESVRPLSESAEHEIGHGEFEQRPGTSLANLNHCVSLRPLLDTLLGRLIGLAGTASHSFSRFELDSHRLPNRDPKP
jgi:hypothetical protein